jgi:ABC-type glycerol-3-phosphate transport system substrate-binding protein
LPFTYENGAIMRKVLALGAALAVLTACGGEAAESAEQGTGASESQAAEPTAPTDPYDVYVKDVEAAGLTPEVKRQEAVSVAGNTCDNTLPDMREFLTTMQTLYAGAEYDNFLEGRAYFIDAYCPNIRVVFDAATESVAGVIVPPA